MRERQLIAWWTVGVVGLLLTTGCAKAALSVSPGNDRKVLTALSIPEGRRPFPALVLVPGCDGPRQYHHEWAEQLRNAGYVTVLVDSYGPRGVREGCSVADIASIPRVADIYAALLYLRAQPSVHSGRIGIIGWSQGGSATLEALATYGRAAARAKPTGPLFGAGIAFYPSCGSGGVNVFYAPLLILIGKRDDWTVIWRCEEMSVAARAAGSSVAVRVYPTAQHGFDDPHTLSAYRPDVQDSNRPGGCCGATVGYDPEASRDAMEEVRRFLAQRLQ